MQNCTDHSRVLTLLALRRRSRHYRTKRFACTRYTDQPIDMAASSSVMSNSDVAAVVSQSQVALTSLASISVTRPNRRSAAQACPFDNKVGILLVGVSRTQRNMHKIQQNLVKSFFSRHWQLQHKTTEQQRMLFKYGKVYLITSQIQ